MGLVACQIIINCGAVVRGAAAGFATLPYASNFATAAATRLDVTNEELCRFAQVVLTSREPIVIEPEYAEKIEQLGKVAVGLAADMNAFIIDSRGGAKASDAIGGRAMQLADAQCALFRKLVDEYGGGA